MALQTNFELDGILHSNCYLKVTKTRSQSTDYEFFDAVSDPNKPDIAEELKWKTRIESYATAQVWIDEIARKNRALPIKNFNFEFEYDLDSRENIYQQAYKALKTHDAFTEAVDV